MQTFYHSPRSRILQLLRTLVEQPRYFTARQFAQRYGVSPDTIKSDLRVMESSGFVPRFDSRFRYYLEEEKPLKQLKSLLHFTEEDQLLLYQAIDYLSPHTKSGALLKEKLGSLYDYSRLGTSYLRKPYLRKVDLLLQAKEDKKQVLLHGYRSGNSNVISNRLVEPFHPSPPDDILHAWDVEKSDKTRIETVFS